MNPPIAARVGGVANRCAAPPSIARTDAIARASTRPRRSSASPHSARAIVRRRRRRTRATIRRHRRGRYFQRHECRDAPETASGRRSGCTRGGDDAYSTHFSTHDAIAWATRTRARSTDGSALKKRSCGFRVLSPDPRAGDNGVAHASNTGDRCWVVQKRVDGDAGPRARATGGRARGPTSTATHDDEPWRSCSLRTSSPSRARSRRRCVARSSSRGRTGETSTSRGWRRDGRLTMRMRARARDR